MKEAELDALAAENAAPAAPAPTEAGTGPGVDRGGESALILAAIEADRFQLRDHAVRRSDERLLTRQQVRSVARSPIAWKYQEEKFTHWFIGFLDESQAGGFTAILDEGEVRIVTVFKRRLSRREKAALPPQPSPTLKQA